MARDATARLYDVDQHSVFFEREPILGKYGLGTIHFQAKPGKLVDLEKLHESVWATRLSGGTRSGLVSLDITTVGIISARGKEFILRVSGSDAQFVLVPNPENKSSGRQLKKAAGRGGRVVQVNGRIDGWEGRWPTVLAKRPGKPLKILVSTVAVEGK